MSGVGSNFERFKYTPKSGYTSSVAGTSNQVLKVRPKSCLSQFAPSLSVCHKCFFTLLLWIYHLHRARSLTVVPNRAIELGIFLCKRNVYTVRLQSEISWTCEAYRREQCFVQLIFGGSQIRQSLAKRPISQLLPDPQEISSHSVT